MTFDEKAVVLRVGVGSEPPISAGPRMWEINISFRIWQKQILHNQVFTCNIKPLHVRVTSHIKPSNVRVTSNIEPSNVARQDYDGFWDGKDAISKVSG